MVIVCAFFLVPFFLFIVLIGKYVDMSSTTLQAARYVAFERTVYSATGNEREADMARLTDAELTNSTRMRFFSAGVDSITQTQNTSVDNFAGKDIWRDQSGQRLIDAGNAPAVGASGASEPLAFAADVTLQNTMGVWQSTVGSVLGNLGGFALNYTKYYTASVAATPLHPVGPSSGPVRFDLLNLTFHAHDTLLADGWSASGIDYEKAQAQRMVPTGVLSFLDNPVVKGLLTTVVPDLGAEANGPPEFGYVVVDTAGSVPADRLKDYTPPPPDTGGDGQDIGKAVEQTIKQFEDMGYTLVSQVTNGDGSVTLTFSKDGMNVSTTVGGSGGGSGNDLPSQKGSVYTVTNATIGSLKTGGYSVQSGPVFMCGSVPCGPVVNGADPAVNATSSTTTLVQSFTQNGKSFTSTIVLTVRPDPADSGKSIPHESSS